MFIHILNFKHQVYPLINFFEAIKIESFLWGKCTGDDFM